MLKQLKAIMPVRMYNSLLKDIAKYNVEASINDEPDNLTVLDKEVMMVKLGDTTHMYVIVARINSEWRYSVVNANGKPMDEIAVRTPVLVIKEDGKALERKEFNQGEK